MTTIDERIAELEKSNAYAKAYIHRLRATTSNTWGRLKAILRMRENITKREKEIELLKNYQPMKKTFNIEYDWTGGTRSLQYTDWFEFTQAIARIDEDPHVILSTIKIWTEEVEDGKV